MQDSTWSNIDAREALIREIEAHDIISFDVFDTLVMRKVYFNKDIFLLLAQQLPPELRAEFFLARVKAQAALSREAYPFVEAIYEKASQSCPFITGREAELIADEIALEKAMIIPRLDVIAVFDLAKQLGKTVNIISDMYFHQDTIRTILEDLGISGYQKLLVSSEYHTSKPQRLFEKYMEEFPTGRCLHIGDSMDCDIIPARKLGIDTFRLRMSTEIYEHEEGAIPPADLHQRTLVAEYVAEKYNSPFYKTGVGTTR